MANRKYNGQETGIITAWTSDLAKAWEGREGTTDSDQTGTTVGGTTADDLHDTRTSLLPSRLQGKDLTALQTEIIEAGVIRPEASAVEIAAITGTSSQWTKIVLGRYLPKHPAGDNSDPDSHPNQLSLTDFVDGESSA